MLGPFSILLLHLLQIHTTNGASYEPKCRHSNTNGGSILGPDAGKSHCHQPTTYVPETLQQHSSCTARDCSGWSYYCCRGCSYGGCCQNCRGGCNARNGACNTWNYWTTGNANAYYVWTAPETWEQRSCDAAWQDNDGGYYSSVWDPRPCASKVFASGQCQGAGEFSPEPAWNNAQNNKAHKGSSLSSYSTEAEARAACIANPSCTMVTQKFADGGTGGGETGKYYTASGDQVTNVGDYINWRTWTLARSRLPDLRLWTSTFTPSCGQCTEGKYSKPNPFGLAPPKVTVTKAPTHDNCLDWKSVSLLQPNHNVNPNECTTIPASYSFKDISISGKSLCCPVGWTKYGDGSGCSSLPGGGGDFCYLYGNDLTSTCPTPCGSVMDAASVTSFSCTSNNIKSTYVLNNKGVRSSTINGPAGGTFVLPSSDVDVRKSINGVYRFDAPSDGGSNGIDKNNKRSLYIFDPNPKWGGGSTWMSNTADHATGTSQVRCRTNKGLNTYSTSLPSSRRVAWSASLKNKAHKGSPLKNTAGQTLTYSTETNARKACVSKPACTMVTHKFADGGTGGGVTGKYYLASGDHVTNIGTYVNWRTWTLTRISNDIIGGVDWTLLSNGKISDGIPASSVDTSIMTMKPLPGHPCMAGLYNEGNEAFVFQEMYTCTALKTDVPGYSTPVHGNQCTKWRHVSHVENDQQQLDLKVGTEPSPFGLYKVNPRRNSGISDSTMTPQLYIYDKLGWGVNGGGRGKSWNTKVSTADIIFGSSWFKSDHSFPSRARFFFLVLFSNIYPIDLFSLHSFRHETSLIFLSVPLMVANGKQLGANGIVDDLLRPLW